MLSAKRVSDENVFLYDRVQADYESCTYAGPGIGRWGPDSGLSLDAMVQRVSGERPSQIDIGVPTFDSDPKFSTIRLRSGKHDRAVVLLRGRLRDQLGVVTNGHLEIRSPSVISWCRDTHPPQRPVGCLFYEGKHDQRLPDQVRTETYIGKRKVNDRYNLGLDFRLNGYDIVIRSTGDQKYTIWWGLPDCDSLHGRVGEWPRALVLAWQLVCGASISPVASEFQDTRRRISVFARREKKVRLGHLKLIDADAGVSGEMVLALCRLFASGSKESAVARHLLLQCFDAVRNDTWQAVMFLMATALEAVLRTLYGHPFSSQGQKHDTYDRNACLDQLWTDYFDGSWAAIKSTVKGAFERVRHRSAHPDWLKSFGGALSSEHMEETFNDLVYLSRFYGFLMLAMAGTPNLEPRFPVPVAKWKPVLRVDHGNANDAK
jgi:hypothetical protein